MLSDMQRSFQRQIETATEQLKFRLKTSRNHHNDANPSCAKDRKKREQSKQKPEDVYSG